MARAFRFTMNYNEYSFKDLKKEYENDKDKSFTWYIPSSSPKIKAVFEEEKKENKKLDAYIYCTNMPDRLNRFVFKGTIKSVEPNEKVSEEDKKYSDYNTKIKIGSIKVYDEKDASALAIRNSSNTPFSPQGTYGELDKKVIDILEKLTPTEKLNAFFKRYIDCECELESKSIKNAKLYHTSFEKENKENYIEFHHIIQRNFGYDDPELLNIIDTCSDNYAKLCPACHRAIHYGKLELRKEMLNILIKNKKGKLESLYNDCLKNDSFKRKVAKYNPKDFKDFIYKIYGITKVE